MSRRMKRRNKIEASTRVDIRHLLICLKRASLAILFITHDLPLGQYVNDRAAILRLESS